MTTIEMTRCKKCGLCTIDDNGKWICKEEEKDIYDIKDNECPLEQDY